MDTLQIASLSTSLSAYNLQNQVSTIVLRKALDNQEATATGIINQIPQVPANSVNWSSREYHRISKFAQLRLRLLGIPEYLCCQARTDAGFFICDLQPFFTQTSAVRGLADVHWHPGAAFKHLSRPQRIHTLAFNDGM